MKNYDLNDIISLGFSGKIIEQRFGKEWELITKDKGKYKYWVFAGNGIADKQPWRLRHVEDQKTLKEAERLINRK